MGGQLDLLLVNPYCLETQPERKTKMEPYPPLGLMALSAWVREQGYSVTIADGTFEPSIESLIDSVKRLDPAIVGLFAMNSFRGEALSVLRSLARDGRSVLCGGPDPSIYPSIYLQAGATAVAHSEGELILTDLLGHYLRHAVSLQEVAGISYSNRGVVVRTPDRAPIPDLLGLPLPAYDLVDIRSYRNAWQSAHGRATINIMTSRGCPFRCNWCARPIFGKNYRLRTVDAVVGEMSMLVREHGVEHFWIFDDTFVVKKSWVEAFCRAMRDASLPATFECMARVDQTTEPLLRQMKEAGCVRIYYGIESGSQRVLDAMQKGTTVEQIRRTAEWMHAIGIKMGAFIMYGYPGEEYEDILMTLNLVRSILPDEFSVSVAHPMPGTGFYENVRDELLAAWAAPEDYHEGELVFRTRYPAFYYKLLKKRTALEWEAARNPGLAGIARALPWRVATAMLSHLPRPNRQVPTVGAVRSKFKVQRHECKAPGSQFRDQGS